VKLQPLNDTPQGRKAVDEEDSAQTAGSSGAAMGRLGISVEPVHGGDSTAAPASVGTCAG